MTSLPELTASDFPSFYRALNNDRYPFPWQERLAALVCDRGWPPSIDLPTGTGKTSCIDIALFAMAVRMSGPRRIFYVVDRRVVVDQGATHMERCARLIEEAAADVLRTVKLRLQALRGYEDSRRRAVEVYEMRGGVYRDDSWAHSPTQPLLIASTVDQTGSRLLFRGYGLSEHTWPIHAALTGNDALILLDEAHCSRAFAQTLGLIDLYRGHASDDVGLPFRFVEMTATPARESSEIPFTLAQPDYENAWLRRRLFAPKPAQLVIARARLKDLRRYAEEYVSQAIELSRKPGLHRIAVMVNRVATAREIYRQLRKEDRAAHLLIGRMRPVDRERLPTAIGEMESGKPRALDEPVFVVATQCLEVGADLDFDGLVTECAAIDALLQRFGRLDRTGALADAGVMPEGRILAADAMTDPKYVDAVYRSALPLTWQWLRQLPSLNFALKTQNGTSVPELVRQLPTGRPEELRTKANPAPILLPVHLDLLVQTSPRPALEPDPALFLHGRERSRAEVQVIWRADLKEDESDVWRDTVALCPPVAAEAMAVPLWEFVRWYRGEGSSAGSDVEAGEDHQIERVRPGTPETEGPPVLRWMGDKSQIATRGSQIAAGDTLILPEERGGFEALGHIPALDEQDIAVDAAERARHSLRRGWVLRLTPALMERWPRNSRWDELKVAVADADATDEALWEAATAYGDALAESKDQSWLHDLLIEIPTPRKRRRPERYPVSEAQGSIHKGWVLSGRFTEADFGEDESSASLDVELDGHLRHVAEAVRTFSAAIGGQRPEAQTLVRAAEYHDCGKADPRFQTLLRGGDAFAAQFAPRLLAKGARPSRSKSARQNNRMRSGLPDGFRHECVSLALLQSQREDSTLQDDLLLHAVASHHGRCRPFAPFVDDALTFVRWNGWTLQSDAAPAAHDLRAGVPERFWKLTRQYGWWGLAWLETLLRLGDWKASRDESERTHD